MHPGHVPASGCAAVSYFRYSESMETEASGARSVAARRPPTTVTARPSQKSTPSGKMTSGSMAVTEIPSTAGLLCGCGCGWAGRNAALLETYGVRQVSGGHVSPNPAKNCPVQRASLDAVIWVRLWPPSSCGVAGRSGARPRRPQSCRVSGMREWNPS